MNNKSENQTIQTYNKIAPDYCKKTRQPEFLEIEDQYIQKLLSYITSQNPLILDVGCGDGRHCKLIEQNEGKAIGIDLSDSILKEAGDYYPQGDFRKMDMSKLEFEDNSCDGIWSCGSIYHVSKAEIGIVIKEFRRILKPDGVVGINFKLGDGEGLEENPKSYGDGARYFAYYTKQEMTKILAQESFEVLDTCTYPEKIYGDNIQQIWFRLK